jgi:hypothetical protein
MNLAASGLWRSGRERWRPREARFDAEPAENRQNQVHGGGMIVNGALRQNLNSTAHKRSFYRVV